MMRKAVAALALLAHIRLGTQKDRGGNPVTAITETLNVSPAVAPLRRGRN